MSVGMVLMLLSSCLIGVVLGVTLTFCKAPSLHNRECTRCRFLRRQAQVVRLDRGTGPDYTVYAVKDTKTGRVNVSRPNPSSPPKVDHTVDMDGLILTESGGDPAAIGDNGRSKGLCQISRAAWEDAETWVNAPHLGYYDSHWKNPTANRKMAHIYINEVIPNKYFKAWGIPDSTYARIAAYKMGPQKFRELYEEKEEQWVYCAPASVNRDIRKYQDFILTTKARRARDNEETRVAADTIQQVME